MTPFVNAVMLLKDGFDRLTAEIIATVPTCADDSQNAIKDVDEAFGNAVSILS